MENIRLGKRLKQYRDQQNLSVKDVSSYLKIAESTYRDWESGTKIAGPRPFIEMAKLYGVPLSELITGETVNSSLIQDIDIIISKLTEIKEKHLPLL